MTDTKRFDEGRLQEVGQGDLLDPASRRLEAALIEARDELCRLEDELALGPADERKAQLVQRCAALLARAQRSAGSNLVYVAWDCLQQLECELVPAMSAERRRVLAVQYQEEARRKLADWRLAAAKALAELARGEPPSVEALQALMRNVHAATQNQQLKLELLNEQLRLTSVLLVASVVGFAVWSHQQDLSWLLQPQAGAGAPAAASASAILLTGMWLGLFGGLLSVAFSLIRADTSESIPRSRLRWAVTLARPFTGAAIAVPIVLLVRSRLINLGDQGAALVPALCFLGGFSERWFLAQVERLTQESS